jgi:signal transduction histidine kinase
MRFFSSLRSRIFLASGLLAVLSIGAATYLVSVRVTRETENSLQREVLVTKTLVEQQRTIRANTFATMARLIADAPKLKAAVDTNDPQTVQETAGEYQNQLNSNLLLVTNRSGQVLARLGMSDETAQLIAGQPDVKQAISGHEVFGMLAQPEGMIQLVTVPIFIGLSNPDILGTLSVGFLLNDALAQQLKEMTGSEIAFGAEGRILVTTLPQEESDSLAGFLSPSDTARDVTLPSGDYVSLTLPLSWIGQVPAAGPEPVALILRSRAEERRVLRSIRSELTLIAVVAALLAMLLSFAVARSITRPLGAITDVMRDVAATGDLTRQIALPGTRRWDDEDARLLAATFNTLTHSIARFQREISQRERLTSLGRLSTVIAHEVRNPLMIIKSALHRLRQSDLNAAGLVESTADIEGEVTRLNRIVNEVLDFARPIRFELAPADVNALCREAAAAAQATPGAAVTLDLDPALPPVVTDAERLRIALVNLIENARQAVAVGEHETVAVAGGGGQAFVGTNIASRVVLTTRPLVDRAEIVIADSGKGIDPSDLARVFDPYFTTKRGGTGLGLPIAKNIVEGLGGTLSVASTSRNGTQIRIELPLGRPDGSPASPPVAR